MGWGGMYHSHEVVQYVVTETFGDPSMSVSGAKKSRLKRNDTDPSKYGHSSM